MKRYILIFLLVLGSFGFGFGLKSYMVATNEKSDFKKVTGIGGIFFKCKEPKKIRAWYQEHLGLNVNQYGAVFEWRQGADSSKKGFLQWSPFAATTKYFAPSEKDFMINYRVEDLHQLVLQLQQDSVVITDSIQSYDYGKFVHIMDPEGNKIELWEANDAEYEKMGLQMGLKTTM